MEKIREILRLRFDCGFNHQNSADLLGISKTWVFECLVRFKESGLSWPLPGSMSDAELEHRLYKETEKATPNHPSPNSVFEQIVTPKNHPDNNKDREFCLEAR